LWKKRVTRSSSCTFRSFTSSMKAVAVASGLVSEERSKMVSGCIGARAGSRLRQPKAAW